jgi:ABC-2 type transport system permease protein
LEGHGELGELEVMDISKALEETYSDSRVRIDEKIDALSHKVEGVSYRVNDFDALIIAKPDSAFPTRDKYVIDQFIMNGGKVLWLLDAMNANLDSLRKNQFSIAVPNDLGLDDMLFNYGVRINKDLVLDRSCAHRIVHPTVREPAQIGTLSVVLGTGADPGKHPPHRQQHRPRTSAFRQQYGHYGK